MIIDHKEIDSCFSKYLKEAHVSVFLFMRQSRKRNYLISRYCIAKIFRELSSKYGKDVFFDGESLNTQRVQGGAMRSINPVFLMTNVNGKPRAPWNEKKLNYDYVDVFA